jgi:hypothetical protein
LGDRLSGRVLVDVGFLCWFSLGSSGGGFSCGSPLLNAVNAEVLHQPLLAISCPFETFGSVCVTPQKPTQKSI